MAQVADYIVMSDESVTIVPNPQTGTAGEHRISITLPSDAVVANARQSAILMFLVRTPGGSVNMEIDLNARRILNLAGLNTPIVQTIHEVIDPNRLRAGLQNDFLFRVVSPPATPPANAELRISDIILWFQRSEPVFGSAE